MVVENEFLNFTEITECAKSVISAKIQQNKLLQNDHLIIFDVLLPTGILSKYYNTDKQNHIGKSAGLMKK